MASTSAPCTPSALSTFAVTCTENGVHVRKQHGASNAVRAQNVCRDVQPRHAGPSQMYDLPFRMCFAHVDVEIRAGAARRLQLPGWITPK